MKGDKFFIGAATAAHQVEGNNKNSDMWAMEQMQYGGFAEKSLDAVDHYSRFREDLQLAADAGLNAYRFSIEWARIEPREGEFCEKEIEHYRKVLETCRNLGILPIVTMHHFSSPKWLISLGGWESEMTADYFARYCRYVMERLGRLMTYVCTVNEANMGRQIAALAKRYAAQPKESMLQVGLDLQDIATRKVQAEHENLQTFGVRHPCVFLSERTEKGDGVIMQTHGKAKDAIKSVCPELKVGLTLSLHDIQTKDGGENLAKKEWDEEFSNYLPYLKGDDFIGVQTYTRSVFGSSRVLTPDKRSRLTQMGYEFYPQALENVINRVYHESSLPIIVTENGVAASDDALRCEFIDEAIKGVQDCRECGVPILGYLHWSLLDNFEWQKGYGKTFGLIGVDRSTQRRKPKASLFLLGGYAKKYEDL